ncbi:hypothetical protein ACVIHC_005877 [Bradyrhizobium diazoefficiens]
MDLRELSAESALEVVGAWVIEASQCDDPANHPSLDALRYVLNTPERSIIGVDRQLAMFEGRSVVGFQIIGEPNVGTKTRFVLPIHFAVMRGLELIPGVRLRLNDDPHRAVYRRRGIERPDDELIYSLSISCKTTLAKEYGLPRRSRLDRILFNAPPDAALNPRRGSDHRYVLPAGSVPIRTRQIDAQTQETWLKVAKSAVRKSHHPNRLAELPEVLRSLFVTADRWHWTELIDRLDADPRLTAA